MDTKMGCLVTIIKDTRSILLADEINTKTATAVIIDRKSVV